jgi:hypothetical protein
MMARGAISVQITGEYNNRDVKRAIADLQLLEKQGGVAAAGMSKMSGVAAGMGAAVGLAAIEAVQAGARMALEFGVNGVKAFLDDEAAAAKLARTMENLGLAQATGAVEANIDALQRQTGVADDLLRPAFDRLVRSLGNVSDANTNLQLALDISAGTGKNLDSVVQALSRGYDGNTAGLSRLGAGLDKATLKTGDMDLITQKLAATFSGQAAVSANTFQGQLDRVQIAIGELQESFGRGFMSGVVQGFTNSENAADSLTASIKLLEPTFYELGKQIGGVVQYIPQFIAGIKVVINGMTVIRESTYLAVKGLIALSQAMSGNFDEASKTITDGVDRVKLSFGAMLEAGANVAGLTFKEPLTGAQKLAIAAEDARDRITALRYEGNATATAFDRSKESVDNYSGSASRASDASQRLADAQKVIADAIANAQRTVTSAIEEFDKYKTKISEGIFSGFDFAAALDVVKEKGTNLIDTLVAQAERASEFGRKMSQLLAAGLNRTSYEQVIALGAERGMDVADAFIDGNITENISRVNEAAKGAVAVADGVGAQSATAFMQAGIDMAVALVKGLLSALGAKGKGRRALEAMMDELASAMSRNANISMTVTGPGGATATSEAPSPGPSAINDFLAGGVVGSDYTFPGFSLSGFANGGSVMGGKPIIVGEKGPELFVPGSNGGIIPNHAMGGNSYSITVQAGVGDPRMIGQQVVEYIKRFEQASGPVFAAA